MLPGGEERGIGLEALALGEGVAGGLEARFVLGLGR